MCDDSDRSEPYLSMKLSDLDIYISIESYDKNTV